MMYLLMQLMEEIVMNRFINLTKRNIKVYFSDKSMFFVSLITPLILLVLYSSFLGNIFKESFISAKKTNLSFCWLPIPTMLSAESNTNTISVLCNSYKASVPVYAINNSKTGLFKAYSSWWAFCSKKEK